MLQASVRSRAKQGGTIRRTYGATPQALLFQTRIGHRREREFQNRPEVAANLSNRESLVGSGTWRFHDRQLRVVRAVDAERPTLVGSRASAPVASTTRFWEQRICPNLGRRAKRPLHFRSRCDPLSR